MKDNLLYQGRNNPMRREAIFHGVMDSTTVVTYDLVTGDMWIGETQIMPNTDLYRECQHKIIQCFALLIPTELN